VSAAVDRALLAGYLRAGWAVTPLLPGTKRPYLNGWGERPSARLRSGMPSRCPAPASAS
jgi:hypothetical protein